MVLSRPLMNGVLGGGIAAVGATADAVTLDIVTGTASVADRIVRAEYAFATPAAPAIVHTVLLSPTTRSVLHGGVGVLTRSVEGEELRLQVVVTTDSRRIFALQLDESESGELPFVRGDANNDGSLNISDPSFILGRLFRGGPEPPCAAAADVDDDEAITLTDAVSLFLYLFASGAEPPAPGVACGFDATPSDLGCEESACISGI